MVLFIAGMCFGYCVAFFTVALMMGARNGRPPRKPEADDERDSDDSGHASLPRGPHLVWVVNRTLPLAGKEDL